MGLATVAAPTVHPIFYRLLVCGLGNPAPYTHTRHSVGNLLLTHLQEKNPHLYTPFTPTDKDWGRGLISHSLDPNWRVTLWQSQSMMNMSGQGITAAYKTFLRENIRKEADEDGTVEEGLLVVVHDELELDEGKVKFTRGMQSCKGHNGLKSVRDRLRAMGVFFQPGLKLKLPKDEVVKSKWCRISVGIGRPSSRSSDAVSKYVLEKVGGNTMRALEGALDDVEPILGACLKGGVTMGKEEKAKAVHKTKKQRQQEKYGKGIEGKIKQAIERRTEMMMAGGEAEMKEERRGGGY